MSSSATQRNLIGQLIDGKYLVRGILGEGGMGTVFEAENRALRRSVAVKVLHPAQARKKVAVKRFHQEARAAGAIGHPNICEVYDLGTLADGSPYLVMECLQGETLADRISAEGGLGFEDVLDIVSQVLSGLVAAHDKGIVHRDIKPENIFLTHRAGIPPVAKLLDFGVSKMMPGWAGGVPGEEEQMNLTRTGMVMGTPYYMSPEQARGDRNLDARVDLWACGVILYEALTGRRPFTAANYNALLLQILSTSPRPARELRPALPAAFDAVLTRSMARPREERYQSAAEFQAALKPLRRNVHPKSATVTLVKKTPVPPLPFRGDAKSSAPPPDPLVSMPVPVPKPKLGPLSDLAPRSGPPGSPGPLSNAKPSAKSGESGSSTHLQPMPPSHHDEPRAPHDRPQPAEILGAPPSARGFDEQPTAIHRPDRGDRAAPSGPTIPGGQIVPPNAHPHQANQANQANQEWDDVTTRHDPRLRPPLTALPSGRARKSEPRPLPNMEDTVKIEGDLEAHFDEIARRKP